MEMPCVLCDLNFCVCFRWNIVFKFLISNVLWLKTLKYQWTKFFKFLYNVIVKCTDSEITASSSIGLEENLPSVSGSILVSYVSFIFRIKLISFCVVFSITRVPVSIAIRIKFIWTTLSTYWKLLDNSFAANTFTKPAAVALTFKTNHGGGRIETRPGYRLAGFSEFSLFSVGSCLQNFVIGTITFVVTFHDHLNLTISIDTV
jgi:hypothetical protein